MVNMNFKISPRCPGAAFQRLLFLYLLLIYYIFGRFFVAETAFDRISACPLLFWGFCIPLLTPFAPFVSEHHPKPKWTFLPASVRSQMMSTLSHPLHPALASKPAFPMAVLPFSMYLFSHPSGFLISLLTDFSTPAELFSTPASFLHSPAHVVHDLLLSAAANRSVFSPATPATSSVWPSPISPGTCFSSAAARQVFPSGTLESLKKDMAKRLPVPIFRTWLQPEGA